MTAFPLALHFENFGDHADCDLRRRIGADIESDRRANFAEPISADFALSQVD